MEFSLSFFLSGALCFAASSISSVGGIGGGGLFVPILAIISGVDLKTASGYSTFMVTGGSLANVMWNLFARSDKLDGRTLIDFDIALLAEPCMLVGVSIGVICNLAFPEWLITIFFSIFLTWSTIKTCGNGLMMWRLESQAAVMDQSEVGEAGNCSCIEIKEPLLVKKPAVNMQYPWIKLAILITIWVSFYLLYLIRGNRYGEGIIHIKACGFTYWFLLFLQLPLAAVFTGCMIMRNDNSDQQANYRTESGRQEGGETARRKLVIPAVALLAGVLGGVFGIGGGMLISPFLLQVGIPPEVSSATCSFMVFFSSTMSSLQLILLGMEDVEGAAALAGVCFTGSAVGLAVGKRAIRKYGRASLIVFSVGIVMLFSTILITTFEAVGIWRDLTRGSYMGFKLPCK